ncbi:MAG TPA: MFS transporter [Acidimicrobiia bacterium]|jgi:predicted MFS family arabinose efflux permease
MLESTSTILRGRPLVTAVIYVMLGILPLYLTSAQVVSLSEELAFGTARLGIATAVHFGVGAAVAHPVGRVVERLGATVGLQLGSAAAAMAGLLAAAAGEWWVLLFVAGLGGVANSFMQVSTNVVLARDAAYRRQGVGFGAKQGAVPLSGAFAGLLLPVVGVAVGWRWTYVLAAALALGSIAFAPQLVNPTHGVTRKRAAGERSPLSAALWWMALGGVFGGAAGNGLSLFVVPSAVEAGFSEAFAGGFLAVSSVLVFTTRIAAGWSADRSASSGHREMIALLGFGTLACTALALSSSPVAFGVAMPLAMIGSWGWPGLVYFTVVRIHPEAAARASGVILAGNLTGTLLGPLAVGFIGERGSFSTAWAMLAAFSAVSVSGMVMSRRKFLVGRTEPDAILHNR